MKPARQKIILEIINEKDIETQFDLIEALKERGVDSTQATLSRDIKDMHLIKEIGPNGKSRYVKSSESVAREKDVRLKKIFKESINTIDIAQNLVVIKTMPGLASAVCSALDSMTFEGLVGTIAGDDTCFIAMKDNAMAVRFYNTVESVMEC